MIGTNGNQTTGRTIAGWIDMKTIELSQGKVALVDDADYDGLSKFKWHAIKGQSTWYAVRNAPICADHKNPRTTVQMHRVILSAKRGQFVDHANGNGLDNRKENIRICDKSQNAMNRRVPKHNVAGIKGVRFDHGHWDARICVHGKNIYLGRFDTSAEATRAYNAGARRYFGEFARLNSEPNV